MALEERADVLVIGGGPGGTPAAMALPRGGKGVLLVVAGRGLGGACLFEGCIPSKVFRETAARRLETARVAEIGLEWPTPGSRWTGPRCLATGSAPNRLPIPGADLPGVLTSEGLIAIGFVPASLVLIGG